MTDRLISLQAAVDALIRKMKPHDNGDGTMTIYVMSERLVKETLNDLPAAQPERCEECENFSKTRLLIPQPDIIRCKDCKHRYVDGDGVRYNACDLNHNKVQSDDWFCADAERREQDD